MVLRAILHKGSEGASVKELQTKLTEAGSHVATTGLFDELTHQEVQKFQREHGLVADGVVGPKMWALFEARGQSEFSCGLMQIELETVLRMCPGAPEENVRQNLPRILKELDIRGLCNEDMIRISIATAYAETGEFAPVSDSKDTDRYKSRGFIKLAGRANYERYGRTLGVDLIANPELATAPTIAAAILCEYLRSREERITMAIETGDLRRARKLINVEAPRLDEFIACVEAWTTPKTRPLSKRAA
jgi:putative chitinase